MTEEYQGAWTRTSKVIDASPQQIYEAFLDPVALADWLPPGGMTGRIHSFDARIGGGYRMSLFYPATETAHRGKTAHNEDMVTVRFLDLAPARRIVEAVRFHSEDAAFAGEMTLEVTLEPASEGTKVTMLFTNLPPGLRPEDNEAGARQSLEQLARRFA